MRRAVAARIAEHAPLLLVYLDASLTVRFVSRHARELLGLPPDDLVGRGLAELLDDATLRYARDHAAEVERGNVAPRDYVLQDRAGHRFVVLVHAVPDRDAQGRSRGYFACTSEAGELRRELQECQAHLARILETALALAAEVDQRRGLDRTRTQQLMRLARELHALAAPSPNPGEGAP